MLKWIVFILLLAVIGFQQWTIITWKDTALDYKEALRGWQRMYYSCKGWPVDSDPKESTPNLPRLPLNK